MDNDDYISVNRHLWNQKAEYHIDSPYYNVHEFVTNRNHHVLKQVELEFLSDINQKRILHLQCHFGLDTLSLARLGASHVTGVDLSDVAVDKARDLAKETNLDHTVHFVCCDIYELERHLPIEQNTLFDIVFTSYGTTKWFPDLNKWARLIKRYLKSDGIFIIVDFHPILWTFDDRFEHLAKHSYFNQEPIVENTQGTYANPNAPIQNKSIRWNHSLADIMTSLLENNLRIDVFKEFDSLPHDAFKNLVRSSNDEQYRFKGLEGKLPLAYAIKATKTVTFKG